MTEIEYTHCSSLLSILYKTEHSRLKTDEGNITSEGFFVRFPMLLTQFFKFIQQLNVSKGYFIK